jgi:hypothetical protein
MLDTGEDAMTISRGLAALCGVVVLASSAAMAQAPISYAPPTPIPAPVKRPISASKSVPGPLYSPAQLRERPLMGVRLGMPVDEARAIVLAQGFVQREPTARRDRWGRFDIQFMKENPAGGWPQYIGLAYEPGPSPRVSSISHDRPLAKGEDRKVEAHRQAILAAYGAPSEWTQWVQEDGRISDQIAYVSSPALRDETTRSILWSCHVDWKDQYNCHQFDCRQTMAAGREPVLEISFGWESVRYTWDDYAARYQTLARSHAFRAMRPGPRICIIPRVH